MTALLEECRVRGIHEVVHFTTDRGLLGILRTGKLLSRNRLNRDQWIEFVKKPNVEVRKDATWLDYVNLSVSAINTAFFQVCAGRWHAGADGLWWCVLAFNPEILGHDGVLFATTNNFYPAALRAPGLAGFRAMFAPSVFGRYGKVVARRSDTPSALPTDPQAEVLYPGELPLAYLRSIYFHSQDHADYFDSMCTVLGRLELRDKAVVSPSVFGAQE